MFKGVKLFIANTALAALFGRHFWAFQKATACVGRAQRDILLRIVHRNASTAFGKEHNYQNIRSIDDFRSNVSLSTYDDYLPAIHSIACGEQSILTTEPITRLEPSSGSTASSKFIPYTESLREEFKKGIAPWLFDLLRSKKELLFGSAYWSISPISSKELPGSKIPVGFGDNASYFGRLEQRLLGDVLAVPSMVSKIEDIETFRYVSLLFLLRDRHLSIISIWNPTFLLLLLQPLSGWMPRLVQDIRYGTISPPSSIDPDLREGLLGKLYPDSKRARDIESAWGTPNFYQTIWPRLHLISCWADGHAKTSVEDVKSLFPHVEIQPKGLIATEGMISFPLIGREGAILSIRSHFFEFIELDVKGRDDQHAVQTKLAYQLEEGKRYSVVITTSGGLYRYQLQDIVQVVGFEKRCPMIRFISKESKVSDLVGEKLNEFHVASALETTFKQCALNPIFSLLAPEKNSAGAYFYVLFVEFKKGETLINTAFSSLKEYFEQRLEENYHYSHAIRLGQLLPVRMFLIDESCKASMIYLDECRKTGQVLGQVKPAILSSKLGWSDCFQGAFVSDL